MSNYLKRGFQVFQVDEDPIPPWLLPDGEQAAPNRPDYEDVPQSWRHLRQ